MIHTADVVVIGGAVMGSSAAYFLSQALGPGVRIVVVERDPSYRKAASALSTSGVRQQFSSGVNVQLSQFTKAFLAEANELLSVEGDAPGITFHEHGYLYLGGSNAVPAFQKNHAVQRALGVNVALLNQSALAARFPWLTVDDLAIGSLGLTGDGWIDGYLLMNAFRRKARACGVTYLRDEVTDVAVRSGGVTGVALASGGAIQTRHVINTSGGQGAAVARRVGLDLPIRNVKQMVFTFESPFRTERMPYLFSPDGLFVRPEGRDYIAGLGIADDAPESNDFEVDHDLFEAEIWPRLAHRVAGFEELRLKGAWAGHYDMNLFDHNAFVGRVPGVEGFYLANGFSGHGMMHSPGIGRALAELVASGRYLSLDLQDLAIDRLALGQPIRESIQY